MVTVAAEAESGWPTVTGTTTAQEFVLDLAREIVGEVAPAELPGFAVLGEGFLRDPGRVLNSRVRSGATLGSGIDTQILVVTPIALAAATVVYEHLLGEAAGYALRRVARAVKGLRRAKPVPGEITDEARDAAVAGTRALVREQTGDAALADKCAQVVHLLLDRRR